MRNYSMKPLRNACKFLIPILLLFSIAAGCSGTTQTSAPLTLVKIPLGHAQNASKTTPVGPPAQTNYLPKTLKDPRLSNLIQHQKATRITLKQHPMICWNLTLTA